MGENWQVDEDVTAKEAAATISRRDAIALTIGAATAALSGAPAHAQGSRNEPVTPVPRASMPSTERLKSL